MFRLRRRVYADNNATTPVDRRVRRRMDQVLRGVWGNPSSLYRDARDAAAVLDDSRRTVASAIGAEPREIIFTGCATEANNTVLKGMAELAPPDRRSIVSSPLEHASVMSTLEWLERRGFSVRWLPVDRQGRIDPAALPELLDGTVMLLCCMLANNETGVIQPIREMSAIARERGIPVMADCVQGLGKVPVDVRDLGIDYASFSAHKVHGPKGVGALYVREGAPFTPFVHGGHQEAGRRAGTEGLHNIAGFAAACEAVPQGLSRSAGTAALTRRFTDGVLALAPGVVLNSPREEGRCLPNTVNITFPKENNALFMAYLDGCGIAVSAGSACNTGEDTPSHVLTALGVTAEEARRSLRFSFSGATTGKDVDYILRVMDDFLQGHTPPVGVVSPGQVDETLLCDPRTYVLDVRHWYDRALLKSLPNAHETSVFTLSRHARLIPRERNILVVCQAGYDSPVAAYLLWRRGFRHVSFMLTGVLGWKLAQPELYRRLAGKSASSLEDEA